ncbi:MAG TPA: DUF4097 family beta strand repeat-containing protein [Terriglobales bacterium]|nr:DUF4097 family beta strand repeat-containing protein [Terriglobales bacterium]
MASTVQAPPPAPPMRSRPPRSFAGPIVLILIGVFFLLGNLRIIEWHHLGYWFAHYWPALLILWGVIKLIEYQQASRAGVRAAGIGAGGVILIIFLVICGLTATEAYRMNWEQIRDEFHIEGDVPWWGHTYSYNDDLQQTFPAGSSLHVVSLRGAVNMSASSDNQIHVTVHKRINAEKQDDADRWNGLTKPQISVNGQIVTLDANTRGAGEHWVSTDLDISLPRKAPVTVSTRHGDISIMGREGNADVTSQDGDVSVTDLNGSLALSLEHSSARVSQVSGDVSVQGRANDVSLEDVKGAVRLDGDFMESVKLTRVAKPVSFKSSRTEMEFSRLDGYLNLDSGDLEANSVIGPLRLRTRSKDIMLNGVTSDVHLQNENGAVEIHLNKLGSLEVTNRRGDIRIFVPEKAGFQLDAQARDGEIQSDFSALKVENADNRSTASGPVNGGGPHMVLNNEHGTIEVRAGAIIPAPPAPPPPPKVHAGANVPQPSEN